jgi:hypothetical protein
MIKTYQNQADWCKADLATPEVKSSLAMFRRLIKKERMGYGDIAELQELAEYIPMGDVQLLEWAGIPEYPEVDTAEVDRLTTIIESEILKFVDLPEHELQTLGSNIYYALQEVSKK